MKKRLIDDVGAFEFEAIREYCRAEYGSAGRINGDRVEIERVGRWHRIGSIDDVLRLIVGGELSRVGRRG